MNRRNQWIAGGSLGVIVVIAASGIAIANGNTEGEAPLTGTALEKAAAAALAHTGGGTVIDSEVGDDGAAYGVEILLDDGSTVEVTLDESFKVTGSQADEDGVNGPDEQSGPDEESGSTES